jgi:hypothetical protein
VPWVDIGHRGMERTITVGLRGKIQALLRRIPYFKTRRSLGMNILFGHES